MSEIGCMSRIIAGLLIGFYIEEELGMFIILVAEMNEQTLLL